MESKEGPMPNYNKVILIGNLTKDPETRYTPEGMPVVGSGIAVNEKYKEREYVLFTDITLFGKTAETFAKFFKKGDAVGLEGKLRLDRWEDKNTGQKRSKHFVVVDRWFFVSDKKAYDDGGGDARAFRRQQGWGLDEDQGHWGQPPELRGDVPL